MKIECIINSTGGNSKTNRFNVLTSLKEDGYITNLKQTATYVWEFEVEPGSTLRTVEEKLVRGKIGYRKG